MKRTFTLIELLVVIAILAFITGIAYPAYISYIIKTKVFTLLSAFDETKVLIDQRAIKLTDLSLYDSREKLHKAFGLINKENNALLPIDSDLLVDSYIDSNTTSGNNVASLCDATNDFYLNNTKK